MIVNDANSSNNPQSATQLLRAKTQAPKLTDRQMRIRLIHRQRVPRAAAIHGLSRRFQAIRRDDVPARVRAGPFGVVGGFVRPGVFFVVGGAEFACGSAARGERVKTSIERNVEETHPPPAPPTFLTH
jgi:hypothetical protein